MLNWIVWNRTLIISLCVSKWLMFNWIVSNKYQYLEPFNFVDLCLQIIYIRYICIKKIWYWITYKGWYAIKPSQTKSLPYWWGLEHANWIPFSQKIGVLSMTLNYIWWWGSSSGDLESGEYPFISSSTLNWRDNTSYSPLNGSNKSVIKLFIFDKVEGKNLQRNNCTKNVNMNA